MADRQLGEIVHSKGFGQRINLKWSHHIVCDLTDNMYPSFACSSHHVHTRLTNVASFGAPSIPIYNTLPKNMAIVGVAHGQLSPGQDGQLVE